MKADDIDELFARSRIVDAPGPDAAGSADPAIERARNAILSDLAPVRPMAPVWRFTLWLMLAGIAIAVLAASVLGMFGVHVLAPTQRVLIFATLLGFFWFAASASARSMRPAGGRDFAPSALALASLAFPVLFALIFQGYGLAHFVQEGIPCLRAGLIIAIPTGLVTAMILRHGFVLSWTRAGMAAGVLAGLSGLGMLELHCQNLKAIHVMVWHVAVVTISGLLGWCIGRIADAVRARSTIRSSLR